MKKRIVSLFLVMTLILALALPAYAAKNEYVSDEFEVLAQEELDELNEAGAELADEYGVDVFFAHTYDDLEDFDVEDTFFKSNDYIALVTNEDYWEVFVKGTPEDFVDDDVTEELWYAYNEADTYVGGIEKYQKQAGKLLKANGAEAGNTGKSEAETEEADDEILRLVDDADLLSASEEKKLLKKLDQTSKELELDIIIVTVEDCDGGDVETFTEDRYDSVYGKNRDGVILLISMAERDWCISGNGEGKTIFTSSNIDAIGSAITDDLSAGNYADAFDLFVDKSVYYIDGARNGYPFNFGTTLIVALVIGLLVAVIVTFVFKSQLKSVHKQAAAQSYVKPGSMQVTLARDFYLYRTVNRTKKANSSSGSSGSHSTGSGKF